MRPIVPSSIPQRRPALVLSILLSLLATLPLAAATLTVNSTADTVAAGDGLCTLREAIVAANTNTASGGVAGECAAGEAPPAVDIVAFALPGGGVQTISPATELPIVSTRMVIDGYSQPGATENSLVEGTNADLRVALDGVGAGNVSGLRIEGAAAALTTVRGLRITRFVNNGILVNNAAQVTVYGNFLGTDGTADLGNDFGVFVLNGAHDVTIGGSSPETRNLIAGNDQGEVVIGHLLTSGVKVRDNLIGTNAAGDGALSGSTGIIVNDAPDAQISLNVVAAADTGILIVGGIATGTKITSNRIGVGVGGADLGGALDGVAISDGSSGAASSTVVGGTAASAGNSIGHWGRDGVRVTRNIALGPTSTGNIIRQNAIAAVGGLPINLVDTVTGTGEGRNSNDAGDADVGANSFQNYPLLGAMAWNGTDLVAHLTLDSAPNETFEVDFYRQAVCDDSVPEGRTEFLGSATVATDGAGQFSDTQLVLTPLMPVTDGFVVTTATRTSTGDTSELGFCYHVLNHAPGVPSSIAIFGGSPQQTVVGTTFAQLLQVVVEDSFGQPVPGVTVTFEAPPMSFQSATLSPNPIVVTDAQGIAEVSALANSNTGAYLVLASVEGAPIKEVAFELENLEATQIPTLGTWGLVALAATLALLGAGQLRGFRGR
jgi:CSLREA domain-containing protein